MRSVLGENREPVSASKKLNKTNKLNLLLSGENMIHFGRNSFVSYFDFCFIIILHSSDEFPITYVQSSTYP